MQMPRREMVLVRIQIGDEVKHPDTERVGIVQDIYENPACLLRTLVVQWVDGEVEEVEELDFGPLND